MAGRGHADHSHGPGAHRGSHAAHAERLGARQSACLLLRALRPLLHAQLRNVHGDSVPDARERAPCAVRGAAAEAHDHLGVGHRRLALLGLLRRLVRLQFLHRAGHDGEFARGAHACPAERCGSRDSAVQHGHGEASQGAHHLGVWPGPLHRQHGLALLVGGAHRPRQHGGGKTCPHCGHSARRGNAHCADHVLRGRLLPQERPFSLPVPLPDILGWHYAFRGREA
mmetsp:Transcript_81643/g.231151  ORF Transcript_81643/g.231151 Transcript_81643/m.231151 type:complete len:226 (+) Transcript_81643:621-1298(+)